MLLADSEEREGRRGVPQAELREYELRMIQEDCNSSLTLFLFDAPSLTAKAPGREGARRRI